MLQTSKDGEERQGMLSAERKQHWQSKPLKDKENKSNEIKTSLCRIHTILNSRKQSILAQYSIYYCFVSKTVLVFLL